MKRPRQSRQGVLLPVALAALAVGALLAWRSPDALEPAYRFATLACLGPALGSLSFTLIHRLTGGQWGDRLRPYLAAGTRLLPWIWAATLPAVLWAAPRPAPATHPVFSSPRWIAVRGLGFGLVLLALAWSARRAEASRPPASFRWLGPAGLIVLVFTVHLLAVDWIFALEPGWSSSGFPLVWMCGQATAGLALAVFGAVRAGADPDALGSAGRPLGIDWGNLLLSAVVVWTYVAFVQFLIIWAGNLPAEISWYVHRSRGIWPAVAIGLAGFHFALPFLFLLSRRFKRLPAGLAGVALVLLACQLLYTAWLVLPSFARSSPGLDLALLAGFGGVCVHVYLRTARAPTPS